MPGTTRRVPSAIAVSSDVRATVIVRLCQRERDRERERERERESSVPVNVRVRVAPIVAGISILLKATRLCTGVTNPGTDAPAPTISSVMK